MQNEFEPADAAKPGVLLVISAPSGVGKTTLVRMLEREMGEKVLFSVSYTTREIRLGEYNGIDYHFVSEGMFKKMLSNEEFLEWAFVHGNYYGTHRSYAEAVATHAAVIFDVDVQGGAQIKQKHPEAVSVFILPPSMAELEHRLRSRGTDADEVIARRLKAASLEIEIGLKAYDYLITNDDLERAYGDLAAIVRAANCRNYYRRRR